MSLMDSLVSSRPEFDLKDGDDGSVVGGLYAGAAAVFQNSYVVDLPAPEHDSVLRKQER